MGDFRKIQTGGLRTWKFQGSIKQEVQFPGVIKKKSCEISKDLGSWPWKFQCV